MTGMDWLVTMGLLDNLRRWLFDFSAGQQEGKRMERILRVVLAETTSETEFHALLYRMIQQDEYLKTQVRWTNTYQLLMEHRGAGEDWRIAAERMIAYLPRFYGYRSEWDARSDGKAGE